MAERRRKQNGVPKHVRGQFDFEHREASVALSETIGAEGKFETVSDGLLIKRFEAPTEGGYDAIELDPEARSVRLLLGGAPHNTHGAAAWWWDGDRRISSWWLHGRQVDQVAVARLTGGEADSFDADVEGGWVDTIDGLQQVIADADGDSAAQDAVLHTSKMLDHPVTDDEVIEDPESSGQALGAARAARAARKAMLQAILEGRDWRQAVGEVRDGIGPFLDSVR